MAGKATELDVDGVLVRVTNPDKPFFPDLGADGTKGRLIDYYRAVADPMVTLLRDRPTHLQRFPDGIDGEEIYQKRVPQKHPDYLHTCVVTFPSGRTADALKIDHAAAIVWAAQMGTVTLHPWPVRCADTDHPDELRIDLDPQPGTGFREARSVAVDVLKPLLDELGLRGYPKTSGGRGVHVFIPITADWDFIEVRRAGIALARELERRAPEAVTTSWWKEERGQRIFIDFNQNARDRTMASPYSVRRTRIATVSMPLTWAEVGDADPDDYTMLTVPGIVAERDDPWAGIDEHRQSLRPLLDMVAEDEQRGLGDLPYPPNYPKMPGEPPRVQPSKKVAANWDEEGNRR
ncbi:non-homologous end-joining DNA ligase [Mycobacterium sp. ACS4331]|uniref:non-homologous end-joining DNA ligase n=1 Tax=Mycobacterium sp. ACS4331 TaxID=1834121 RepID=UPI0007FCB474|nr:non-homologous end-joining DNA ligase [Mycobacterium sp. ACS4331]OBF10916.1 ATP-dependent DNA ligase [Mycobacterium sp. ACS4331]